MTFLPLTFLIEEVLYHCSELAKSLIYNEFTEILYNGCLNIGNCIFVIKCCMTHTGWSADINQEIPYDGDDGEYLTCCPLSSVSKLEFSLAAVSLPEDTLWWGAPHMPVSLTTLSTRTLNSCIIIGRYFKMESTAHAVLCPHCLNWNPHW